jgi:glycosyltransferase involved in cell wall biosynthesis
MPLVSIGVPVYNGENYLRRALDSIVSQTYSNLEIVIGDNASTDGTEAICREFAGRDARIRYHRHPVNMGASANHEFVFRTSTAEYYKAAAHDDEIAPTYVEKAVAELEAHPGVAMVITRVTEIDENSRWTKEIDSHLKGMNSPDPVKRLGLIMCRPNWATPVFGMMRRSSFKGKEILGRYTGSDRTFLAEMALAGPWRQVDEVLFMRREHATTSTKSFPNEWQRRQWFDTSATRSKVAFPQWKRLAEYASLIRRSGLSPLARTRAYGQLLRWTVTPFHRPRILKLIRDPAVVAWRMLRSQRA